MNSNKIIKAVNNPKGAMRYIYSKIIGKKRQYVTKFTSKYPIGTNIFKANWDLLIILDSCRYDMLKEISHKYDFIKNTERRWSIGGTSPEWLAQTFNVNHIDTIRNTGYITSNPHSKTVIEDQLTGTYRESSSDIIRMQKHGGQNYSPVSEHDLALYNPVWKNQYHEDEESSFYDLFGDLDLVTDHAIHADRELTVPRLVLHYMPPHRPYIINAIKENRELYCYESNPFNHLRQGGDKDTVLNAYSDMLNWVLDEVSTLLNNMDREKVVITADHGEAFGEFGVYNHHAGSLHPNTRWIPWVQTTADDEKTYTPKKHQIETENSQNVQQERLESLGYL